MTKVIFKEDYDFRPDADWRIVVEFKASEEPQTVTRECAQKAIKAKKAIAYKEPKKEKPNAKRSAKTQDKD